ncbi:MAG: cell division protein FtsQ/DivIB [Rickettsiales bacterium]|nr:cell division protein FtsQ/DivIB [Rickettsiales bacterium]
MPKERKRSDKLTSIINKRLTESIFIRKIRNYWNHKIKPTISKIILFSFLALVISTFISYKFFPNIIYKIEKVVINKFDKNTNLLNWKNLELKITGNQRTSGEELIAVVKTTIDDYVKQNSTPSNNFHSNLKSPINAIIENIKKYSPWINSVEVRRNLANILEVKITEYQPFVIWQDDKQKYIADKTGHMIKIDNQEESFDSMIIISGDKAYENIDSLFNIFVSNPELGAKIYSATWIGNRRWDIRFDNGVLVKLPESNINNAWQRLLEIYSTTNYFSEIKLIDLRITDKSYIEYYGISNHNNNKEANNS